MPLEFSAIEFEYCESLELLEEFFHKYINIRSCQLLRINPETKKWNCSIATRANRRETRYLLICYSSSVASSDQGNRKCRNADH